MLVLPKVRFAIVLIGLCLFGFGYIERDIIVLQYVFFTVFFFINTYVMVYVFFAVVIEGIGKILDYITLALIFLLNLFSIYTGYSNWVVAYTSIIILCFVAIPFIYYYFNSKKKEE